MRQVTVSHEDYDEINQHMIMLNLLINSHVHNHKRSSINYTAGIPEPEKQAIINLIKNIIDEFIEEGVFKEYIDNI
jgi:hypothetical protein